MLSQEHLLVAGYGWIRPLAVWRASPEQRAQALKPFESAALLDRVRRDGDRQILLVLHQLATGMELWAPGRVRAEDLMEAIDSAVSSGILLLLRESPTAVQNPRSIQSTEDRLIEGVMRNRRTLTFQGQRYSFKPADRWSARDRGGEYVPVPAEAARDLSARMEASWARTPAEHAAWQALADALTGRRAGAGILMLQYRPVSSSPNPRPDGPAATPSQLAPKVAERDWIELNLQWDDGTAFDGDFLLALPGGRTTKGPPDEGGVVRVDNLDSGDCELTFPGLFPEAAG